MKTGDGFMSRSPFSRIPRLGLRIVCAVVTLVGALLPAQAAAFLTPDEVADAISREERASIELAVPEKATVAPRKPRRLLVFDHNVGYGGHPSAAHANYAFSLMGRKTGAFETVVSHDPAAFERASLPSFDAVFFNNNVGNLFETDQLRRNLVEFIMTGGGLLGVHGTAVAFTRWPGAIEDWPEFGYMLGARGANHRISTEHVFIQLDDPGHPLNLAFGGRDFDYRDEFFRVHEPYSRDRVRVLFRIDTKRTDMNQGQAYGQIDRADQDYALAWIRNYGRGRTFYCTIAHNPYVFSDPVMLKFYLDAIQFALGDLDAPTTPSARLTPAISAQEKLRWRLAAVDAGAHRSTLFDLMDNAHARGLSFLSASGEGAIVADQRGIVGPELTESQRQAIRLRLDAFGLRLLSYHLARLPVDPSAVRQTLEFARLIGVETVLVDSVPDDLSKVASLCEALDLQLAIGCGNQPNAEHLSDLLEQFRQLGPRIGFQAGLAELVHAGFDPADCIGLFGNRLFVLQLPEDMPVENQGGSLETVIEAWLRAIRDFDSAPVLFTLALPERVEATIPMLEDFNHAVLRLAQ